MKILHLYHDIMNLYGEYANVSALTRLLQHMGTEVTVDKRSLQDTVDLSEYDFVYVGSGTERNQKVVLEHLRSMKEALTDYIEQDKVILMTGNAFEMLGSSITDSSGKATQGLGLFPFTVTEQNKTRVTGDAIFSTDCCEHKLVGFINKCSTISGIETPLFTVEMGIGNQDNDTKEGIHYRRFFGTHLTGPILIKNPYFLIYIVSLLAGEDTPVPADSLSYETAGYEVTLSELTKRMNNT